MAFGAFHFSLEAWIPQRVLGMHGMYVLVANDGGLSRKPRDVRCVDAWTTDGDVEDGRQMT